MNQTATVTYSRPWYRNINVYVCAILIIFLSRLLGSALSLSMPLSLILATQVVLFILFFRRPVWAMASLLIGQFTAAGYMLPIAGGTLLSVRFLWTIMAIAILIPILRLRGGINTGSRTRSIIIPTAIFFALAGIANAANVDMANMLQYIRTGVTALAIIFLIPAVIKNEKDLKLLTIVILIAGFISAAAAVMQHYRQMGFPVWTLGGETILRRGRALGLSESFVHLSFELPMIILPMITLLLTKGVSRKMMILLPVLGLVMILGLYFTYTRSGMYSLIPGGLLAVLLLQGKMKKEIFIIALIAVVGFLFYTNVMAGTTNRYSKGFNEDSSAAGRLVLWQAGALIALDHPIFGIGAGRFTDISEQYSGSVTESSVKGAMGALGMEEAHNDFIRVWVSFGTPALLAYLWALINVFRSFLYAYRRSPGAFHKGMALGGLAALMAFIVNSATHNVMDSVPLLWILGGFSLALVKLAEKRRPVAVTEGPINLQAVNRLTDTASPQV